MNDETNKGSLADIFEQSEGADMDNLASGEEARDIFKEIAESEGEDFNDLEGSDDNPLEGLFDDEIEEEIPDVGFSWMSVFWGVLLGLSVLGFLFTAFKNNQEQQSINASRSAVLELESDVKDIAYQSLLAFNGQDDAFEKLQTLRNQIDGNLDVLETVAGSTQAVNSAGLDRVKVDWAQLGPQVDLLAGNRGVISSTLQQVTAVNTLTPQLLSQTDVVVNRLIENEAPLKLINIGSRQRFLSQRIKASANEFATGALGWQDAAMQFEKDVKLFGEVNNDIRRMGGVAVSGDLSDIDQSYERLVSSAASIMGNVEDYFTIRDAATRISNLSDSMQSGLGDTISGIGNDADKLPFLKNLPWILGGLGLLGLVGLIWALLRQNQKREQVNKLRTKRAEDAVIKLLDEMGDLAQGDLTVEAEVTNEVTGAIADSVNFAIGEMRILVNGIKTASNEMSNTTEDSEQMIAQLLTSNDAQSEVILGAAQEIERMSETMSGMSHLALQSSERAQVAADSAKKGAAAVRDTIVGMNSTRNQIQDTAKRLKRLGESSQQINEIVNLIQDVTEQTNVLSLNASIQAAMAGEAGRGFAVVAEEVQRLADRSARASGEITELVKNIQQDANNAIASMETTTEEVITGATMADQAGQALDEIERISQELLEVIEKVAAEATEESKVANTISGRMNTLKSATEQSDMSVSQVAGALGQIRDVVDKLDKSVAGFRLPA